MWDVRTHHDSRTERTPHVHVRNARVDVEPNGLTILDEDLLEKHPGYLACLNICIRDKVTFWPVTDSPT